MNIPVSVPDNLKQLVIDGANLPETLSLDQVRELAMAFASVALSKDEIEDSIFQPHSLP